MSKKMGYFWKFLLAVKHSHFVKSQYKNSLKQSTVLSAFYSFAIQNNTLESTRLHSPAHQLTTGSTDYSLPPTSPSVHSGRWQSPLVMSFLPEMKFISSSLSGLPEPHCTLQAEWILISNWQQSNNDVVKQAGSRPRRIGNKCCHAQTLLRSCAPL